MAVMGRPAVFRKKLAENNIHARMTAEGSRLFEQARARLATIVDWKPARVSDSDVLEYLARGEKATRAYLKSGKLT